MSDFIILSTAGGFLELKYNSGVAFGFFHNAPDFSFMISSACLVIIMSVIIFSRSKIIRLSLSIMAGGSLANLLSRIINGCVIDYIALPFSDLNFNLADIEISLGAFLTLIYLLKKSSASEI